MGPTSRLLWTNFHSLTSSRISVVNTQSGAVAFQKVASLLARVPFKSYIKAKNVML